MTGAWLAHSYCALTVHASLQGGAELPGLDGEIELKNVTFAYPARPDRLVFKQFNLHIKAGE